MGSEVSVLAAWREISLGKRGGESVIRRLTQETRNRKKPLGCHEEISARSLFQTFFAKNR